MVMADTLVASESPVMALPETVKVSAQQRELAGMGRRSPRAIWGHRYHRCASRASAGCDRPCAGVRAARGEARVASRHKTPVSGRATGIFPLNASGCWRHMTGGQARGGGQAH